MLCWTSLVPRPSWPSICCLQYTSIKHYRTHPNYCKIPCLALASYPAFSPQHLLLAVLTRGKAWYNWVTWYDVPGRMEEWHIPGKTASKRVRYRLQTRTVERLSAWHQTVLATFLGFRKPLYSCTEGMCHSSTRPGTSYHVTRFYQAFPRVSTASDKRWGEKAWVRGYHLWLLITIFRQAYETAHTCIKCMCYRQLQDL